MTFPPNLGEVSKADGVVLNGGSSSLCFSPLEGVSGNSAPATRAPRLHTISICLRLWRQDAADMKPLAFE